ncbi:MAG: hypothetical protein KAW46_11535, partial [candidate division Zixibacteria bacterium]|nr:hypothetical protein [candidate division Zixibacteria bacterium]
MNRHRGRAISSLRYFVRVIRIITALTVLGTLVGPVCHSDVMAGSGLLESSSADAAYTLWLDSARAYPGDNVSYDINLTNDQPVGSFNLLIKYDASAMWPISLTAADTRAADFEYFEYTYDEFATPGLVRIVGIADLGGATPQPAESLPPGDGSLARFIFVIANDIDLAGIYIPIRFKFLDAPVNDDNTVTDDAGVKIEQS